MASKKKRKVRVKVRGYEPEDARAVSSILGSRGVVEETMQVPHRPVSEATGRFAKRDSRNRILVAEMDGDVAAVGGLRLHRSLRARHAASLWLAVADDVRGRGIGGLVVDELLDLGEKWMGVLRFEIAVFVDNEAAIKLYRERGFEIEGVVQAAALRDGKLVDNFSMARVAEMLPYPRITVRDVAQKIPALLPSGPDRSKN
ncbi:MAG: GNAT family N-acetyltransferase [Deltaproteobacteria bacterium]|nr:GNAT family N-acetyltransferase [Deltaproteobacteria bacterium]